MTTSLTRIPAVPAGIDEAIESARMPQPGAARDPSAHPPHRGDRPLETEYRPAHPLDLRRTVLFQRRGAGDPTMTVDGAVIWRASRNPDGVATLALRETSSGIVRGAAWDPGQPGRWRSCPPC